MGGFAGGEQGVQQFVEEGTIKLADQSRPQQSPLIIAGIVAVVGTIGGLLFLTVRFCSLQRLLYHAMSPVQLMCTPEQCLLPLLWSCLHAENHTV